MNDSDLIKLLMIRAAKLEQIIMWINGGQYASSLNFDEDIDNSTITDKEGAKALMRSKP